jgi:hypothetical protein
VDEVNSLEIRGEAVGYFGLEAEGAQSLGGLSHLDGVAAWVR